MRIEFFRDALALGPMRLRNLPIAWAPPYAVLTTAVLNSLRTGVAESPEKLIASLSHHILFIIKEELS